MAGEKIIEKLPADNAEKLPVPESQPGFKEKQAEQARPSTERIKVPAPLAEKSAPATNIVAAAKAQDFQKRRAQEIDQILAEGLHEVFLSLTPEKQREFKEKGEATTLKINALLNEAKTKVGRIIDLIKQWLRLIPGINKFFLEQEAKIKADKIIKIKNKF